MLPWWCASFGSLGLAAAAAGWVDNSVLGGFEPWNFDVTILMRVALIPSLPEELFWRVALRPGPTWSSPRSLAVNAAFAASHLVTGRIIEPLRPGAPRVFSDPAFLGLASVLGLCCTHAYLATRSIAAPVTVHALAVSVWLSCFEGEAKLSAQLATSSSTKEARGVSSERPTARG